MDKIKIGLIGLGVMGNNHLNTLKTIPEVSILGVCDQIKLSDSPSIVCYGKTEELLEKNPDGIIIATPTSTHKNIALSCLKKNIPVLIEKPVASTAKEAKEILSLLEKKETTASAYVGYIERFNPAIEAIKKEIQSSDIVKILITRTGPYPSRITDVGILCDLAVHDLDLLRYVCEDEFESHTIYTTQTIHTYEDSAFVSGKMSRGAIVSISTSWLSPIRKRHMDIYTKDHLYQVDLLNKKVWKQSLDEVTQKAQTKELMFSTKQALKSQLSNWLKFLQNKSPCRLASVSDSLKTLEIIETNSHKKTRKDSPLTKKESTIASEPENYLF